VEFYGPGAVSLPVTDRATIANMAPEYGATMGFFGIDEETIAYLRATGRSEEQCVTVKNYYEAQGLWGIPTEKGVLDFTTEMEMDLGDVVPCVSGPKRPQDRIEVPALKSKFNELLVADVKAGGYGKKPTGNGAGELDVGPGLDGEADGNSVSQAFGAEVGVVTEPADANGKTLFEVTVDSKAGIKDAIADGSVLIAAITSCTNTSNPSVMLAAGLLAQKANALGLVAVW
jgi:aconitate hydratase